jgi:hypothetical protein
MYLKGFLRCIVEGDLQLSRTKETSDKVRVTEGEDGKEMGPCMDKNAQQCGLEICPDPIMM